MSMARSSLASPWLRMIASVLAIRFPWLTFTSRGVPVDPEVAISAASSSSRHGAAGVVPELAGPGGPASCTSPQRAAQSSGAPRSVQTARAPALRASASPEVASVLSLVGTATNPPNIAPRDARALSGRRLQPISTRSPRCRPAAAKLVAKSAIVAGSSVRRSPLGASSSSEPRPSRSARRAAKFHCSARLISCNGLLGELRLHDPHDFAHVFHFHQLIDVESQVELLLETAGKGDMTHRVPRSDIRRYRVDRD